LLAKVNTIKRKEGFDDAPDLASKGAESRRFDKVAVKVEDGELLVEGEKKISERVEGLGGEFAFCTLGEPIDAEKILSGENLPDYENLGTWLVHTATGGTLDPKRTKPKSFYLGEAENRHL
jgi:adenine-specific DNA-methyltransferase